MRPVDFPIARHVAVPLRDEAGGLLGANLFELGQHVGRQLTRPLAGFACGLNGVPRVLALDVDEAYIRI